MSWAIGYDGKWARDIGYGIPATCDHPDCKKKIDRGLSYVCGGEPFGGEEGCGLYFCASHLFQVYYEEADERHEWCGQLCEWCRDQKRAFSPKPDRNVWVRHKLKHSSWQQWRDENPKEVAQLLKQIS